MMPADDAAAGIRGKVLRGKEILPSPLPSCIGILSVERERQIHHAASGSEVGVVHSLDMRKLSAHRLDQN